MADDKEKFAALISKLVPINELPPAVQNEVINRCQFIKVRKGGHVFKQGDRDEFSYYLLDGEIDLIANNQQHGTIVAGTDRARLAMAQLQPRQFSARAVKTSTVMQIPRDFLDKLLVVHQKDEPEDVTNYDLATAEVEVEELHAADDVDWMTKMLQSELFSKMPTANIQSLFALLEPVEYQKGDVVIRQGEPGEHYFIIQEGHCHVLRAPPSGGKEIKLADLGPGDSFGEEALITDTPRNATVVMATPGVLMRLEKEKFIELIKKPTLRGVNFDQAVKLVIEGAQWLDVRFKNEYDQGAIRDCLHIPLNVLRLSFDKLNASKPYVVYCDTGGRSSAAAFLMAERGFKVWYLQGGLTNNPKAAEALQVPEGEGRMIEPPPPAGAKAPPARPAPARTAPPPSPPPPAAAEEESMDADKLDPAIKASVLETELARTNHQLEEMERQRKEIMDQAKKAAQAEVARRLQAERDKIEAAKRKAEDEAKRLREEEEARIRRMKEEAEARLQAEKQKLEEVYSRNAEEMEKLQRQKQEAEEQMRRERERLEQEAEQARRHLEEAQKIKKQVEAARKQMEQEAERKRKEQEEMEREIQRNAREKLELERRKLAEQFARSNQEMEQARQERAAADAAREAAKQEAERIIAEYKAKHEEMRREEEARMRAERERLEQEQRRIRDMLEQSERVRREAEAAKSAAAQEVEQLRARQYAGGSSGGAERERLDSEIRAAEERLQRARRDAEAAERDRENAEQAQRINEEDLVKRYEIEEETRKALEQDLEQFKEHLAQEEKKFASIASQMDHMRRIKKRAEEAKQATKQHTESLLTDVASQLRKGE
jgi:CRP-like cAMP-binding protein/rhodanese-related sulfurtransferase